MKLRMDNQLINGNGSAPNLTGVLNKSGINTFAYGSYTGELRKIGQIYQAITEIRKDAFVEPDAIVMHPGPVNYVEITESVYQSEQSVIRNQIANGVAIRMAVLYLLAAKN